jgi:Eco57I restriction-modification methylase
MAGPRRVRQREAQLGFDALSIEGGLLSADWLSRAAQLKAGGQGEADYHIPRGLNLRDEIGRYWRIAQAHWSDFALGRANGGDPRALSERFVHALLRDSLGFVSLAMTSPVAIAGRSYPIGCCALGGRVPIVTAPAGSGLDTLTLVFGDGSRRRSAFGLTQEFLNAADAAMWGLASDGLVLRIVRDNASLTRPAWIEADLSRLFTEELYADFTALWLLAHETRFGRPDQPVTECALETWRNAGREEGTRAREHLRRGVEEALIALGQGFLAHADNLSLRTALQDGSLTTKDYFNQLLRLVYRVIFLLTVEERGLLHPTGSAETARELYAEGYCLKRLRDRSIRRSAHDRFPDLWEAMKIIFRGTARGQSLLALPPLGGLFAEDQCQALEASRLENRALLLAVYRLSWLREDTGLSRVNWRDMGPEELGSVYEGLLELVPHVEQNGRSFAFAKSGATRGNARKLTGSYYTPDVLVQRLLDEALEPVMQATIAAHPERPADALLQLAVIDPACGSGHFLLSAARRIASQVARINASGTPTPVEYRRALRQVVSRCIFGIDRNPMALELARVALWLEAMTSDAPLTFVDHHLVCGDALIGLVDLAVLRNGIPSEAYEPVDGDDKDVAQRLAKKNRHGLREIEKRRKSGQLGLSFLDPEVVRQLQELDVLPDGTLEAVVAKREALQKALTERQDAKAHPLGLAADLLVAAFLAPKTPKTESGVPTTPDVLGVLSGVQPSPAVANFARAIAREARVLHWKLTFGQVFGRGGFDVVLGNPPWDALSPDAKEFFSQWDTGVRFQSPDDQQATIDGLKRDPTIARAWEEHCHALYCSVAFMKSSGRYSLFAPGNLGKGDFNVYRMFVETALRTVRAAGRASQIVPEGFYNGANCMAIREELFERCSLLSVLAFENHRHVWFESIDTRTKFALYAAEIPGTTDQLRVAFNIRSEADLAAATRDASIKMPVALVREFSPDALALMEFGSQTDISIAVKMYGCHPKFGDGTAGPPHRHYMAELHMGNDRDLFVEDSAAIPVYEGRMVAQYDHRAKGYRSGRGRQAAWQDLAFANPSKSIQPQWFVARDKVPDKIRERYLHYRIGFCDVASPTNERTLVSTLIPPGCICGDKVPTITFPGYPFAHAVWIGVANSFAMDFIARKKVALKMSYTVLDSLPFPRFAAADGPPKYIVPRVARLICTGPEMLDFWDQLAEDDWVPRRPEAMAIPGEMNDQRRALLEAELDSYVAKEVFGLSRDELSFVLDTFPIVEKRDQKVFADYRTKQRILESFDLLVKAPAGGIP